MRGARSPKRDFPWWLVIVLAVGAALLWQVAASDLYTEILDVVRRYNALGWTTQLIEPGNTRAPGTLPDETNDRLTHVVTFTVPSDHPSLLL